MKLNHINLTVADVDAAARFLEKYMGMRYQGGNRGMGFLYDDDGLVLSLMKGRVGQVKYPGNFHIGFILGSEAEVDEVNRRLKEDGFEVPPPEHLHGYTFYVNAPGGITVEVLC
ncbi:MAG: VOC family protein [Anaerolineales bacterium]|nr:MAG: VOC family protein [Anaerolineales bacterium]